MLFTMMIPFLEVVLHTGTEVMKRAVGPQFSPNGWVPKVKPAHMLGTKMPKSFLLPAWVGVVGRLLLPIISLIFTATFGIIGLIVSYWPNTQQDPNMTDCLTINLD